ncbi:hypothetical protein VTN00DRAFT_3301 [Thermoascus crustaceus]|uniref:uncharacterized protein n=1 Tax=Thermoascus crustaceus TaxID=5088 RepID=UPI0037442E43
MHSQFPRFEKLAQEQAHLAEKCEAHNALQAAMAKIDCLKKQQKLLEQQGTQMVILGLNSLEKLKERDYYRGLTLKTHYLTCLRKARTAEARVQALCCRQGLPPGLVRRIQVAAVQAVALYGAELWWQGQKDRLTGIQQLRQAQAVTGMFRTSPIGPLIREAGLEPAETLLEARQLGYTIRLLGLPNSYPTRQVLPVTFREGTAMPKPGSDR